MADQAATEALTRTLRELEAELARVSNRIEPLEQKRSELQSALQGVEAALRLLNGGDRKVAGKGSNRTSAVRDILYAAGGSISVRQITETLKANDIDPGNPNSVSAILSRLQTRGQARSLGNGMWEAVGQANNITVSGMDSEGMPLVQRM